MKWTEEKIKILRLKVEDGITYSEIAKELGTTYGAISSKIRGLKDLRSKNRDFEIWSKEDINKLLVLKKEGKTPLEISKIISNRSPQAIESKLKNLRKRNIDIPRCERLNKFSTINWNEILENHKKYRSINELCKSYGFSSKIYYKAIDKNLIPKLEFKVKKIKKEREYKSKQGKEGYIFRQKCKFKFNVYDYPDYFDLNLLREHGWYSAKNRGNNFGGVVRDHIYSISDGLSNNVDPKILSHPANCRLIKHSENIKKHKLSYISLEELLEKIKEFNFKYKVPG